MEFLYEYGLFLAKAVTLVAAIVAVIVAAAAANRAGKGTKGELKVHNLTDKFHEYEEKLNHQLLSDDQLKARDKARKADEKAKAKANKGQEREGRLFLIDFKAGIDAAQVNQLREEISALLTVAEAKDEVLVRVESGGGMVHAYGLAASQLDRIRQAKIPLTIAVDKVAASGGYMMACVADKIIAAPFAIVGSIGVIAQIPNFNKLLKKHDIDFEQHTAGDFKRTLTMFGENNDAGREKFREELEQTHVLFKEFVQRYRPELDLDKVATGEHWFGLQAKDLGLVDAIQTSDDFLMAQGKEILQLQYEEKKNLAKRFGRAAESAVERGTLKLAELTQRPH
ncbi:protease SohB [Ferrimonas balearica]|uniref:protease SohB n=1 Tax=Ferrimonas balearica TaxID=44012 RepID=UPI001C996BC7|nr:protease SohB [Ferrimonas balearica]MBY5922211.1 protease SohB [Ferrimonas balearica]MBY5994449.1 protease SohB [Ferrimonas balearica]